MAFAALPAVSFGLAAVAAGADRRLDETPVDALIVAEAVTLAGAMNQAFKFSVARERPFVHARTPAERAARADPDDNLSFYSGHTSFAFALAVSSGTVASMRRYRLAPWVWAVGLSAAAATGWLRIAADKHYFTDVVAGAAMGSAFGLGVPYLLHRPGDRAGAARPGIFAQGRSIVLAGAW